MANITPVQVWYKGEQRNANVFTLYSIGDNLLDSATFQYQLIEEINISPENINSLTLIVNQISINSEDYAQWDLEPDANAWIYNWAADQLGLVII